jgi:hypothetical protein
LVLTFEREVSDLEAAGVLGAADAARLRAIERREIFSIYPELRILSWAGVMLIVAGVGVLVSKNLDRIGPAALASAIALAVAACYAYAVRRRASAAQSVVGDYVLLLGALLLSADLGYVESQFHLLDHGWPRHFLVLAVVHGVAAYFFASRALLSLSISALAAWLGIEQRVETIFDSSTDTSIRAFLAAGIVLLWRLADRHARPSRMFERVFDHFAANLALLGALVLTVDSPTRLPGSLLTLVIAGAVIAYGVWTETEALVLYPYVYAVVAVDIVVVDQLHRETSILLYLSMSTIAAIVGLFLLHARYRRRQA